MSPTLKLRFDGLSWADLQGPAGLARLDALFRERLVAAEPELAARLAALRAGETFEPEALSGLLVAVAPHLERFLAQGFGIEAELAALRATTVAQNVIDAFRREWIAKRVRRFREPIAGDFAALDAALDRLLADAGLEGSDREHAIAQYAMGLDASSPEASTLLHWCVLAQRDPAGQAAVAGWRSFRSPQRVDHAQLVALEPVPGDELRRRQGPSVNHRPRDGFALTDPRMDRRNVQAEVNYCVFCHDHDGDFCSKGFPEKKGAPELGLKVNPLGEVLTGCPLGEKISEMHLLKRDGHAIAALAVAMIDNPMLPATGHRICNDCMKACIYQKQQPVDIPQIETRVLTDVLALPWGVELYDLLARFNPLRATQPCMRSYNGTKVLIAGLGPAGFTMAHHLSMEGCAVVGIDGLKLEPLPRELLDAPVRDYAMLEEPLESRVMSGFGGVAEYGITVRWDKNFLKLIHLALARRATFQAFGGVRLGGTLTLDDAWREGFDHVCIATGAGLPKVIPMGHSLARGMRQANDFLMALQLTGAAKRDSIANLQVRLPAVVIGGGLTAVDAATEVQAYYVVQVEKTLTRYERLVDSIGESAARARLDAENNGVLDEFLAHGRAVRAVRAQAEQAGIAPDFLPLLRGWGGVTIAYRRSLNESPAYLRNHEEVVRALEEGIYYAEALEPLRAELDQHEHVEAVVFRRRERAEDGRWLEKWSELRLPARAVLIAAGASPNTVYETEHRGTFQLDGRHFLPHVCHHDQLQPVDVAAHAKAREFGPFTSYSSNGHTVTFIGDTHPVFHGSVVKAIASAQRSYPYVLKAIADCAPVVDGHGEASELRAFYARMSERLVARVARVLTGDPGVIELHVRAPQAAANFRPGQFFRLQTYEHAAPVVHGTRVQIPVQTVSGAGVDGDMVRLMLLRGGANAEIAARLQADEPVVLMGPTGAPAHLPRDRDVLVIAGAWGAAVMLDLGPALRAAGNRVHYIAAYGSREQCYARAELEQAADRILWACARGEAIENARAGDRSVIEGDVIALLERAAAGEFGAEWKPGSIEQVYVMGSTGLLAALQGRWHSELRAHFAPDVAITGTVGTPMQCMLKGVCGQCLQWQIDPETGERTRAVFACAMQDQPLEWIDLDNLAARQAQNRLSEHLTNLWVRHLLDHGRETP
ncbi:MAG: FAD-dependent oxidoreductase [Chromatiales bacterium]|nr:FAD-dependent oxidoreductase [Chromatiales bacterium]